MERIKTTVRICGRDYTISGVGSEEQIKRVAVYVDRKMQELMFSTRLPQPMVAVLAAMNIADDLIKAQDENTQLRRELLEIKTHADVKHTGKVVVMPRGTNENAPEDVPQEADSPPDGP